MKKKVLMLLVLLTVSYANAQIYKPNNTKVMSKFDIKEYEKMPKSKETGFYVNEYGNEIDILYLKESNERYQVTEYEKGTRYEYTKIYDANNNLKVIMIYFGNLPIRTTRYYDLFGYVIKEVDEEKDFPVTLDKLREIVLKNLKVDIATDTSYWIFRTTKNKDVENIPTYEIYVVEGEEKPFKEYYLIDARTGNLLFKTENISLGKGIQKYIESKK